LAQLPSNGLLKVILTSLGEIPKRGKDKLYSQILDRARRVEGTLLLIFDEAHLLRKRSKGTLLLFGGWLACGQLVL
jgi:hypothetical protein